MQWKKTARSKAQFLIIPHDIDVFAFAKEMHYGRKVEEPVTAQEGDP
jgi:hypothetical protein